MKARDNPFTVQRVLRLRYRLSESQWGHFLQHLERREYRGALVGPEGSGKTTLLEDLGARLELQGMATRWLRLSRERRPEWRSLCEEWIAGLRADDVILFDGAEQIPWWSWRGFLRQVRFARGLVITTHRSGRLPTLRHCRTSLELTQSLVEQLIGPLHSEGKQRITTLYSRHRGNVRDVLRTLYDHYAEDGRPLSDSHSPPNLSIQPTGLAPEPMVFPFRFRFPGSPRCGRENPGRPTLSCGKVIVAKRLDVPKAD
jgi:hypothetical protein